MASLKGYVTWFGQSGHPVEHSWTREFKQSQTSAWEPEIVVGTTALLQILSWTRGSWTYRTSIFQLREAATVETRKHGEDARQSLKNTSTDIASQKHHGNGFLEPLSWVSFRNRSWGPRDQPYPSSQIEWTVVLTTDAASPQNRKIDDPRLTIASFLYLSPQNRQWVVRISRWR